MCFSQIWVKLQCFGCGYLSFGKRLRRGQGFQIGKNYVAVRNACIGWGVFSIFADCLLEVLQRCSDGFGIPLVPIVSRLEISLARCRIPRRRSEEHTSELQSHHDLVCRLLLEKKKNTNNITY